MNDSGDFFQAILKHQDYSDYLLNTLETILEPDIIIVSDIFMHINCFTNTHVLIK